MRAALNGRILVLDGIEKAERNVLPVLNNLLENREMPLEDGRFLMSSSRFDKLLEVLNFLFGVERNYEAFLYILKFCLFSIGSD